MLVEGVGGRIGEDDGPVDRLVLDAQGLLGGRRHVGAAVGRLALLGATPLAVGVAPVYHLGLQVGGGQGEVGEHSICHLLVTTAADDCELVGNLTFL